MEKDSYLINQLAERAGVTVRTIRYYVNEGLLPPPQTKGRYSAYDEDYLYRIRLIKFYKEAYLPLSRIRELLEDMTPEQIRETVEKYEKEPPDFNLPSPSEPLVLGQENLSARSYLRKIKEPPAPQYRMENVASESRALPQRVPPSESIPVPGSEDNSIDFIPDFLKPAGQNPLRWMRIELDDGMELMVREDIYQRRRQEIDLLIARLGRGNRRI